jgi:hypothetical protein
VNFRPFTISLLLALALGTSAARADISGHSSAMCGGVMLTLDELQKSVEAGLAPTDFSPLTYAEANVEGFSKYVEQFGEKPAAEAREKIAKFRSRQGMPGIRTSAMVFSGEGATQFLKSSVIGAQEIGNQAGKKFIFKKWMIGFFGIRSLMSLSAMPHLLSMQSDKWWYTLPTLLFAAQFGQPVVKSLLRLRESPLEKFMLEEFQKIGMTSKDGALHMLSITGKQTSDFQTLLTVEENARAPWVQQMVFDARTAGTTRLKRILRGKNPLVVPRKTAHIDLIAMPYGADGQRQVLVLTAEGI